MREELDIITACQKVGTYRGAADICGTTHKTVKRVVERHAAGQDRPVRAPRPANYEDVRTLVAQDVKDTRGRISAKRLLPRARAAGYTGSARNFRRLVAQEKKAWRAQHGRTHRPASWSPGEHLVIDWGVIAGVHVFAAVLAWSRFRFVRFAADEKAATTMAMLAECFEVLGGTPKVVLADRMGCLKGGVVANRVVPTPDYVRFATHYRFRPDFCEAADPESKGIVEALVRYGKDDLARPLILEHAGSGDLAAGAARVLADLGGANQRAADWCAEVNAALHSEIAAVPDQRLAKEVDLLTELPSLRPLIGPAPVRRKVDKLSTIRPPLDDTGAQLLFRFVAAAYERRSLGVASHHSFEDWGRFLPEHTTALSMLDRLLHHATTVVTNGQSYRMRQARQRRGGELPPPDQPRRGWGLPPGQNRGLPTGR